MSTNSRRALRFVPAVLLGLFLSLAGCSSDNGSTTTVSGGGVSPACFTGGGTPILDMTAPDPNYTWNDPHVLKVGGEYWMYASATDSFVFPVRIYRLVSTDGVNFTRNPATPVFSPSTAYDSAGVETPAVVYFGGQYHLFYTGYTDQADVFSYIVGHATSPDGISWTPDAAPVVEPTDPVTGFRQYVVGEPGPVVVGGTLHLYFTAVGYNAAVSNSLQVIGLTTTADGTTWSTPASVLEPDQTLYPRGDGWMGYSTPNAIVLGGEVHLFFDVAYDPTGTNWRQIRLHHARSADGVTGWVQDSSAIHADTDFSWTRRGIRSPDALLDGTTLRLYFAGDSWDAAFTPMEFGIGLATCDVGAGF